MKRLLSSVAVLVFLAAWLPPSGAAALQGVRWADLPEHLAQKGIPVEAWPVTDCPADRGATQPARLVAQWIENTFYLWEEYEQADRAGTNVFIVLRQPRQQALSAEESRTLLTASTLWRKLTPVPGAEVRTIEADDPSLRARLQALPEATEADLQRPDRAPDVPETGSTRAAAPPVETPVPPQARATAHLSRGVIGQDDRVRVTNTKAFPWYLMAFLRSRYSGYTARGSGCMVSPYMVLTCGHVVYNQDDKTWPANIEIVPGQRQWAGSTSVYQPWGMRYGDYFSTNTKYMSGGSWAYDYGCVHFDSPFWSVATYLPVEFDTRLPEGSILNMSGYPSRAQGYGTYGQWYCYGEVLEATNRIVRADFDATGGNSGSALYYYVPSEKVRRICGILAFGSTTYNGGPQLVWQNKEVILDWLQWTPDGRLAPSVPVPGPARSPAAGDREDTAVDWASGEDITVTTPPGQAAHLRFVAADDPQDVRLQLRFQPPTFATLFEGHWMPLGPPSAAARTYGKGFKLREAVAGENGVVWTFRHLALKGLYDLQGNFGEGWQQLMRFDCTPQ